MSVPAKLLPDAVVHFPILAQHSLRMALNQELSYEVPVECLGAKTKLSCLPECFFLLERTREEGHQLIPASPDEVQRYFEHSLERLPNELPELTRARSAMISKISYLSCWRLLYGGPPQVAVQALRTLMMQHQRQRSA